MPNSEDRRPGAGRYAQVEREQRWVALGVPDDAAQSTAIVDRYVNGTTLRLRASTSSGRTVYKFGQKVRPDPADPEIVWLTNIYLPEDEYAVLAMLPANELRKVRWRVERGGRVFAVDVHDGHLDGLVIAETELGPDESLLPPPDFTVLDVTDDDRYSGAALANAAERPDNVRLRDAAFDDRELLEYWDTKQHVIDSGGVDDELEWEVELRHTGDYQWIVIAEVDGRPVGVVQICDPHREPTNYWGEIEPGRAAIDIWIGEERDLGRGYGSQMMRLALDRCFADPEVVEVLIDPLLSNTRAIAFYGRLGFVEVGERWFVEDHCLVMRIDRSTHERRSRPAPA